MHAEKSYHELIYENEVLRNRVKQLEKQENRLTDKLVNSAPIFIYVYDVEEQCNVYSNDGITKILGYTSKELADLGDNLFLQLIHPDDLPKVMDHHKLICKNNNAEVYEIHYRFRHKNGDWLVLNSRDMVHKRNDKGEAKQISGILMDQTEQYFAQLKLKEQTQMIEEQNHALLTTNAELRQAKEKAEESEKQFARLFENLEQGFALHEMIYNETGDPIDYRFLLTNKAFSSLTGLSREQLIGKTVKEIMPNTESIWIQNYGKVAKTGVALHFENHSQELGKYYNVIAYSPKENFFAVVFTDVTQSKTYQQELLKAKERAEESDRLKSEFLNNMSHEIRTPMNGIVGFTGLLENDGLSPLKRKHYINIIQNSCSQLLRIIDDILEISTLETKQATVTKNTVCLNEMLLELFTIYDSKAKDKKLPFYLKRSLNDAQSTITTDRAKLNKVLGHLIDNALKFTNQGYVEMGYSCSPTAITIYVRDTGPGIPQSKQKIIFDRFTQVNKDIASKAGGLGLGLSIAKENIQLLGGEIKLESEPGLGTTFIISLPMPAIVAAPQNTETAQAETPPKKHQYKILIAEDEEINFLLLDTLIKDELKMSCEILHAYDGEQAIELFNEVPNIDLILMDIKMPKMDGLTATKIIRQGSPKVPIIAQTAYSTQNEKNSALFAGCNGFISKPIRTDTLRQVINEFLLKTK